MQLSLFSTLAMFTFISLSFFSGTSLAQVSCSQAHTCKVARMPMLNQKHPDLMGKWGLRGDETSLCGPAAAAMALGALVEGDSRVLPRSITHYFSSLSPAAKVDYLAGLMNTDRIRGTSPMMMASVYMARARDFSSRYSASWVRNSKTVAVNHAALLARMRAGKVSTIQFGHYYMRCRNMINGTRRCFFSRDGGHAMALNAINSGKTTFYDPDDALVRTHMIRGVPRETSNGQKIDFVFPSIFSVETAHSLTDDGSYFAFIESLVSVGGRDNRR